MSLLFSLTLILFIALTHYGSLRLRSANDSLDSRAGLKLKAGFKVKAGSSF